MRGSRHTVISVGYGLFTGGLGMHYGAERLGCTVIPVASGMTERQVQLILDFQPDIIIPTPSYLLVILDEFRSRELDPSKTSLRSRSAARSLGQTRCARK
jgi:phenylacetate-CoA ligase